jgi:hypothetical protein
LFARFLPIFTAANRDINTRLEDGSTFLDLVLQHRKSAAYAGALRDNSAISSKD